MAERLVIRGGRVIDSAQGVDRKADVLIRDGRVEDELPSAHYEVRGRPKVVRYWLLRHSGGQFLPNDEVDDVRWLSPVDAVSLLSYEHDRLLLTEVPADPIL